MIHVPVIPTIPLLWSESWTRGSGEPDRWTATKKYLSGVVAHEVEFSNASFYPGVKGTPTFSCNVTVDRPRGYEMVADCDRPLPSVWYPMHACVRRFALYPKDRPDLRPEAERVARGFYDVRKWRRGRLAYGPCNLPLPDLSVTQAAQEAFKISTWLNELRTHLVHGTSGGTEQVPTGGWDYQEGPVTPPMDGWRPFGPPERYAQGGSGVFFYTGYEQAPDSPAFNWLNACGHHERRWHAYHRGSGDPITVYDYGDPSPMYQEGSQSAINRFLPEFQGVAPWPDPMLLTYDPAHSIRGFRHLIACSEMMDSPAVKRMLRSQAAQFRLQCSDIGPHPSGGYTPPALRTFLGWAQGAPSTGFFGKDTGRQLGWPAFVIAQSIKRAGATVNNPWAAMFAEFAQTAAMPSGIVSRCADPDPASVWYDAQNDTSQAFEVPIFWHGAVGCSIYGKRPIANAARFATTLYEDAPLLPYYSGHGPPHFAFTAARGGAPYQTVTSGKVSSGGDSTHCLAGCALAASLDGNKSRWVAAAHRITAFSDFRESAGIVAVEQRL